MQTVDLGPRGVVEFPDDATEADIKSALLGMDMDEAAKESQKFQNQDKALAAGQAAAQSIDFLGATGRVLSGIGKAGGALVEDVAHGDLGPTFGKSFLPRFIGGPNNEVAEPPKGPVEKGVVGMVETLPVIAAGAALQRAGVPGPMAFGALMGAQAAGEGADVSQIIHSGVVGAAIPESGAMGKDIAVKLLNTAVESGLLSAKRATVQKAVEVMASQGGMQMFMHGIDLPQWATLPPEERKKYLKEKTIENAAWFLMEVPHFLPGVPSETQRQLRPEVVAADALKSAADNPAFIDALDKHAMEAARQASMPVQRWGAERDRQPLAEQFAAGVETRNVPVQASARVRPTQPYVPPEPGPMGEIPPAGMPPVPPQIAPEKGPENAPEIRQQPENNIIQPSRTTLGENLPANPPEVRQGEGGQAGGGNRPKPVAPQKAPVEPVPVAASKLTPADLQPALLVDGNPIVGGESHVQIYQNLKDTFYDPLKLINALATDQAHIFTDAQGKIYTRDDAGKVLGLNEPLTSERLTELRKVTAPVEKPAELSGKTGELATPPASARASEILEKLRKRVNAPAEPESPKDFPKHPDLKYFEKGSNLISDFSKASDAWKLKVAEWLKGRPESKAIVWEEPEREYGKGNVYALTRNVGEKPWRVTSFAEREGKYMPLGHREYSTREEALAEEGQSIEQGQLRDKMPGPVMTEQEIYGWKEMADIADPSKLAWYRYSGSMDALQNKLKGSTILQTLVRDSNKNDMVAFVEPVTLEGDPTRLQWLGLKPVFNVDDKVLWKSPGGGDVVVNYRGPLGDDKAVVAFNKGMQMSVQADALHHLPKDYKEPTLPPVAPETGTVPSGDSSRVTDGGKAPAGNTPSLTAEPGSPGRSATAIRSELADTKDKLRKLVDQHKRLSKIGDTTKAAARKKAIAKLEEKIRNLKGELTFVQVNRRPRERGSLSKGGIDEQDGLLLTIVGSIGKIPIFMPDGNVMSQYLRLKSLPIRSPAQVEQFSKILEKWPPNYEDNYGSRGSIARAAYDAAKRAGIDIELFQPVKDGSRVKLDTILDQVKQRTGREYSGRELYEEIERLANAHYERTKGIQTEEAQNEQLDVAEKQTIAFQRDQKRPDGPGRNTDTLGEEELIEGAKFTFNGAKFKITTVHRDEDGGITGVTLDDGNKYGTQYVDVEDGSRRVKIDTGSMKFPKEEGDVSFLDEEVPAVPKSEEPAKPTPQRTPPDVSGTGYDDLVKATYAGEKARQVLDGLRPSLYQDAKDFFESNLEPTEQAIERWLESRGTMGAVELLVKEIARAQKLFSDVALEAAALKELRVREKSPSAPAKPSEKPTSISDKPAPAKPQAEVQEQKPPTPAVADKLTASERKELSALVLKGRAYRDAAGEPLTNEETVRYTELTAKAGQKSLFDVDEVVSGNEKLRLEAEKRNLERKMAELERLRELTAENLRKSPRLDTKFREEVAQYTRAIAEIQSKLAEIDNKLAGRTSKADQQDIFEQPAKAEPTIEDDLFSKPEQPAAAPAEKVEKPSAPPPVAPVSGLTAEESARLAELTDKVESGAPMTSAEKKRFRKLQAKAGARSLDEKTGVKSGEDEEPRADLGGGLPEGHGMDEAQVRDTVKDVDTAGFPVNVITKQEAADITGMPQARGYGGFFWRGKIYLVRDNLDRDPKYAEQVRQLMREEVGHGLLRTEPGRKLLSEVLDAGKLNLTEEEKNVLREKGYQEHQLLDEFIAKSVRENRPWWQKLVLRVREQLAKLGLANLSNDEVSRILLRNIRSELSKRAEAARPSIQVQRGGRLRAPGMVTIREGVYPAIVAHHGTPHEVDRFSLDKINTGQGAQSYGRGLYFADNPLVAEDYRKTVGTPGREALEQYFKPGNIVRSYGGGFDIVKAFDWNDGRWSVKVHTAVKDPDGTWREYLPERDRVHSTYPDRKVMEEAGVRVGNTYTVKLDAEPEQFIDWDKPLSEQSKLVQDALKEFTDDMVNTTGVEPSNITGETAYRSLAIAMSGYDHRHEQIGAKEASAWLASKGIKGIRYLDQWSRDTKVFKSAYGDGPRRFVVEYTENRVAKVASFKTQQEADAFAASKRTRNYVIFDDKIISITGKNGQVIEPKSVLPEEPAPSAPVGERDPQMRNTKVAGERIGVERPAEYIEGIRDRMRTGYFDGTQPVEENRSRNAWEIADRMVNPATSGEFASELTRSGGGTMAAGLLRNELWDYSVRMAARGDASLMRFMVERSQDFKTIDPEEAGGDTQAGRVLRAARERAYGGLWRRLVAYTKAELEVAGRRLGKGAEGLNQLIDSMSRLVTEAGTPEELDRQIRTPEIDAAVETPERRQAAEEIAAEAAFTAPSGRKTILETVYQWLGQEVNPDRDQASFTDSLKAELIRLRLTDEQAQTIADATWNRKITVDGAVRRRLWDRELRRLDNLADKTAQAFILRVDQAEWKRPEQPNEVRDIIKEALTSKRELDPSNLTGFKRELTQRLLTAGLSEQSTRDLANAITQKRETDLLNAQLKVRDRAANSNNLRSLIESIQASPYLAQKDPQWRLETATRWFESNGVPREQAVQAAKLFDAQFVDAMARAAERIAKRLITKGDYPRTIPELIAAVRAGLTDPSKTWAGELATRSGFKPLTPEQQSKLADLEQKYAEPNRTASEQAELVEQMMGVMRHAGDPSGRFARAAAESFSASLLSGVRTATLNWLQPMVTLMTNYATSAVFQPKDFGTLTKALVEAAKNWWPEYKFAMAKDAYAMYSEEKVFHSNHLKRIWEEAQRDWTDKKYATAVTKFMFGWQQYVMRSLQAADQAGMAVSREWKMALYGSSAMRDAGLNTKQIGQLVDVVAGFKRAAFEQAIADGRTPMQARVIADDVVAEKLTDFFENQTGSRNTAEKILEASVYDSFLSVGRRAPGVTEDAEGFLSKKLGVNWIMKEVSKARASGGGASILSILAFGFMNVPLRTARFYAQYSPYGLLRWGINKYRTSHGEESFWSQSFKNDLQARIRLREAIAGTTLMALLTAWQANQSTADDDIKKHIFGLFVTGAGPKNKTMRDSWLKQGFQPYCLNVLAGGEVVARIPVNRAGQIFSTAAGLAGALDDVAWRRKEDRAAGREDKAPIAREALAAIGTYYDIVGAQGVLQSFSHLSQMGRGESGTGRAVGVAAASTASALMVPGKSFLGSISDMIYGPVDRSSAEAAMMANFPVLNAMWNGKAINRFGDEVGDRTWSATITRLGVPFVFRVPETKENQGIYSMIVDKGAAPPDLRRYLVEDKYGPLTQDQWNQFVSKSGGYLKSSVLDSLGMLKDADPTAVRSFLSKAASAANNRAAAELQLTPQKAPASSSGPSGPSGSSSPSASLPREPKIDLPAGVSGEGSAPLGGSGRVSGGFAPRRVSLGRGVMTGNGLRTPRSASRRFVSGRLRKSSGMRRRFGVRIRKPRTSSVGVSHHRRISLKG